MGDVGLAGAQGGGGIRSFFLAGSLPATMREVEAALDEFEEAAGFGFDQVLLARGEELHGQRLLVLPRLADQVAATGPASGRR